jgi:hypothetical protein
MADLRKFQTFVLTRLEDGLDTNLSYHSLEHTIDVVSAANRIAQIERMNEENLEIINVAAVMHDTGFLVQYFNNEPEACKLAVEWMPQFGYNQSQINAVCEMIMATKIPQTPPHHLARIICDADLDYLGRNDFFPIGQKLFEEFLLYGVVDGEESWNRLQVSFLETHQFFTETASKTRSPVKLQHLDRLKTLVNSYI